MVISLIIDSVRLRALRQENQTRQRLMKTSQLLKLLTVDIMTKKTLHTEQQILKAVAVLSLPKR